MIVSANLVKQKRAVNFLHKYKGYLSILLLVLLTTGCATFYMPKTTKDVVIKLTSKKLPEYEKLVYEVKWLGIPVGTVTASIKGIKKINGIDAYVLEVVAKTNAFCSSIYKIEDRFISYMDVENLFTLRHEVYRREGRYKKDAITDFDQVNHKAYFKNLLDKSEKIFDIPAGVQDTLSACYYFMLLPLNVGDKVEYDVCNNENVYKLFALILSKGYISIPNLGNSKAFFIQPYAKLNGKRVEKAKVSAYFSCDEKRIPLLALIKGPIFTKLSIHLKK